MAKREIAYVMRMYFGYTCSACGKDITEIISKKHFRKIVSRIIEEKIESLKIHCPNCKRELNFKGLKVQIVNKNL